MGTLLVIIIFIHSYNEIVHSLQLFNTFMDERRGVIYGSKGSGDLTEMC